MPRSVFSSVLGWMLLASIAPQPVNADWSITVDVDLRRGQPYIPLVHMTQSLGLNYQINPDSKALNFSYRGREVAISDQPVMLISEQLIPLSVKPYWQGPELWVPLDAVQKIFYVHVNWRMRTREVIFSSEQSAP